MQTLPENNLEARTGYSLYRPVVAAVNTGAPPFPSKSATILRQADSLLPPGVPLITLDQK